VGVANMRSPASPTPIDAALLEIRINDEFMVFLVIE
jgi:hypothetical protein